MIVRNNPHNIIRTLSKSMIKALSSARGHNCTMNALCNRRLVAPVQTPKGWWTWHRTVLGYLVLEQLEPGVLHQGPVAEQGMEEGLQVWRVGLTLVDCHENGEDK